MDTQSPSPAFDQYVSKATPEQLSKLLDLMETAETVIHGEELGKFRRKIGVAAAALAGKKREEIQGVFGQLRELLPPETIPARPVPISNVTEDTEELYTFLAEMRDSDRFETVRNSMGQTADYLAEKNPETIKLAKEAMGEDFVKLAKALGYQIAETTPASEGAEVPPPPDSQTQLKTEPPPEEEEEAPLSRTA